MLFRKHNSKWDTYGRWRIVLAVKIHEVYFA